MNDFLAPENLPFTVALGLMLALAVLESVSTLMGHAFSDLADAALPDSDIDSDGLLGWLHLGRAPLLMLVIVFLTAFGVVGLLIQIAARGVTGSFFSPWLVSLPAFALALPAVRLMGGVIARWMPKDETTAVSEDSLLGRVATITIGVAAPGQPAEARCRDEHGQTHYLMVEPDLPDGSFPAGSEVLLVRREAATYRAIANPHASLSDN